MRPPTDEEHKRYMAAAHAVQTGTKHVAHTRHLGADRGELQRYIDNRTGLNCVMAEFAGLTKLLVDKGVITAVEFYASIAEGLEREKERLEEEIAGGNGSKITLT